METNLAGKTYEVYTGNSGKWTYENNFNVKSKAIQHAEALLGTNKFERVKVVAESDRRGEEIVYEEEAELTDKGIQAVPIEESPVCTELEDLYTLEARLTGGRLLRKYLDDLGMTATELMYDFGRLRMFERQDALFRGAMGRLAGIQARKMEEKPADRSDKLYRLFSQLQDKAQWATEQDEYHSLVATKGLQGLIDHVNGSELRENRHFYILCGIAGFLAEQADWNSKIEALVGQVGETPSIAVRGYADEILSEILDGAEAVNDVIGGAADAATAMRTLIRLSKGTLPEVKNPLGCVNELNQLLSRVELPNVSDVLLQRVAQTVRGVKPLTKEGRVGERNACVAIIRDLTDPTGLSGGTAIAEAVTLRAKSAMGGEAGDLSVPDAIARVVNSLPALPMRAGYLLDVSPAPFAEKYQPLVVKGLATVMQKMTSAAALAPNDDWEEAERIAGALKEKIDNSALPAELKKTADVTLTRALAKRDDASATPTGQGGGGAASAALAVRPTGGIPIPANATPAERAMVQAAAEKQAPKKGGDNRRELKKGELLFEEGDAGTEAYLISSGNIEIFRRGVIERRLAILSKGDMFGEMSLIDDQPRMASARALDPCVVMILSNESLKMRLDRLEQSDRVLRRLMDMLTDRIRGMARSAE